MAREGWHAAARRGSLVVLLAATVAGCSSTKHAAHPTLPAFCTQRYPAAECVVSDRGRFAVAIVALLQSAARQVGIPIGSTVTTSLDHIASLLPGPHTNVLMFSGTQVIPGLGVNGFTDPISGEVEIAIDVRQSPSALRRSLSVWLLPALAHEVDHSVRIQAGPGFGRTLLEQLISEGLSTAFELQVDPHIQLPWTHALSAGEEREMWRRTRPLLGAFGLYDEWFFGSGGILHWTGFQIGYHIVRDYLLRHPGLTAASLVDTPAAVIFSGSHYTP